MIPAKLDRKVQLEALVRLVKLDLREQQVYRDPLDRLDQLVMSDYRVQRAILVRLVRKVELENSAQMDHLDKPVHRATLVQRDQSELWAYRVIMVRRAFRVLMA